MTRDSTNFVVDATSWMVSASYGVGSPVPTRRPPVSRTTGSPRTYTDTAEPVSQAFVKKVSNTSATGSYPGGMVPDASLPFFDLIGIMSYDQVGPTWGTPGGEHSTYTQAEADLRLWIGKGVPASKLALGMPFYGRGFGTYREGWSLQDIASQFGDRPLNADVAGQRCGGCSYITYNGLPTLERKAELAGAWGAGVMVWEVGQDLQDGRAIRSVVRAYERGRSDARKH